MKFLLDTHVFLWWCEDDARLNSEARRAIAEADVVFISVASAWEVAIKAGLRKLHFQVPFAEAVEINRFSELLISFAHAGAVRELPHHHRDPFDRMLVVQAQLDGLTLITARPPV